MVKTPMLITGISNRRQSGFTLVELMLVLFIIGIFSALTIPSIADIGRLKLSKNGLRVARTISYLYAQAAARGELVRLHFDIASGEYTALHQVGYGKFEPAGFSGFSKGRLTDGIKILRFTTLYNGTFSGESAYIHLMPEGFAEKAVIVLGDSHGRVISLLVNQFTGKVSVVEGEKELEILEIAA